VNKRKGRKEEKKGRKEGKKGREEKVILEGGTYCRGCAGRKKGSRKKGRGKGRKKGRGGEKKGEEEKKKSPTAPCGQLRAPPRCEPPEGRAETRRGGGRDGQRDIGAVNG
jgi:hypothetical protein